MLGPHEAVCWDHVKPYVGTTWGLMLRPCTAYVGTTWGPMVGPREAVFWHLLGQCMHTESDVSPLFLMLWLLENCNICWWQTAAIDIFKGGCAAESFGVRGVLYGGMSGGGGGLIHRRD